MSLDPEYLEYPKRTKGMDHDLYPWSNMHERAPISLPGGASLGVALLVSVEWFPIVPGPSPFRAPGHMQTAYPDYRHYTAREYGTRVGLYRILDAFAATDVRASFAVNAAIAQRYPGIITDILAGGHEIVAHGIDMDSTIDGTVEADAEREMIRKARDMLARACGAPPRGWMSIARSQSWNTPSLLVEEGFEYCLDWVNDELPYVQTTKAGPLISIPYNHELSDRQIVIDQQHSSASYFRQLRDAADWLCGEGAPRVLPVHLTPYITGLPFRIGDLEDFLSDMRDRADTCSMSAGDLASALTGAG